MTGCRNSNVLLRRFDIQEDERLLLQHVEQVK
jgi:hypothetical protein